MIAEWKFFFKYSTPFMCLVAIVTPYGIFKQKHLDLKKVYFKNKSRLYGGAKNPQY